jgi:uncharacterized protein (DUF1800 family)
MRGDFQTMSLEATIATNRFGLGATPGLITSVARDPKAWLLAQVRSPATARITGSGLQSSQQAFAAFADYSRSRREMRQTKQTSMTEMSVLPAANQDVAALANLGARSMAIDVEARIGQAMTTQAPFLERWALFWSNRHTMSAKNLQTIFYAGPYEREAIRPYVLGSFADLLKATSLHAGMLVYLDQVRSIGPNAPVTNMARQRRRELGLNENLAREILELHTLGPNGGYSQADVTEFARALTGWTLQVPRYAQTRQGQEPYGSVVFIDALHEPGPRTIMGTRFEQSGREQALAILDWLARQPQTARNIAQAVATHFVSDQPPLSLVSRLEQNFRTTNGDLAALAQTLINSPEAWVPAQGKFKSPQDFLISTLRASGTRTVSMPALRSTFEQLGQTPWRAPSPKGWPDTAGHWAAPDAILKRVDWSNLAADVIGQTMAPMAFGEAALGPTLTPQTRTAISRAQDARQGIVLVLMSPEFQRR